MRGQTSSSKIGLMPRLGWSAPLTRSIQVKDGPALRTLNDARAYMLDHLPEADQPRQSWQKAAELLLPPLMAWTTSALRPGRSSLRYSCRPNWCRQETKGRETIRDKKPRCAAGLECP